MEDKITEAIFEPFEENKVNAMFKTFSKNVLVQV